MCLVRRDDDDGQNVPDQSGSALAEVDPMLSQGGTTLRYYIHGATYIDERAVLHDSINDADYYYVPRELHSVEALVNNRGHEVERYSYDAYGQPQITIIHIVDVNYDGVLNASDGATVVSYAGQDPCAVGPIYDINGDGQITLTGEMSLPKPPPPALVASPASGVGNPYAFTGRRMDHVDDFSLLLYHYRARAYDPQHGRFMQRDPMLYVDGMNMYEYVRSISSSRTDPNGQNSGDWDLPAWSDDGKEPFSNNVAKRIRDDAIYLLETIRSKNESYLMFKITGLDRALSRMLRAVYKTEFRSLEAHWFKEWRYDAAGLYSNGAIYLRTNATETTVFHELVHALQDYSIFGLSDEITDEGEAWAAELQLNQLWNFRDVEDALRKGNCAQAKDSWNGAWIGINGYVSSPGIIGFPAVDHSGNTVGQVTAAHVGSVGALTGFHIRCQALADKYNKLRKFQRQEQMPCCIEFVCRPPKKDTETGPGDPLKAVWK